MKNSSSHWVLTLAITFWTFGSSLGLQLPTWEFIWECEGSFPHTLLHSRRHENATLRFSLCSHPCKPLCLGREPKARVATPSLPKVLKFFEFTTLGQAKKVQEQHFFGCVRSWEITHMNLTIVKRVRALSTPLSFPLFLCFCFCWSIHLSYHHNRLDVVARTKVKCEGQ
jgi:hypothetical protein